MRNSTRTQNKALYENIMKDVSKLLKKRLNEVSDELLNRATLAAMDRGDYDRARRFNDYKNSDIRKNLKPADGVLDTPISICVYKNKKQSKQWNDIYVEGLRNGTFKPLRYDSITRNYLKCNISDCTVPFISIRAVHFCDTYGIETIRDLNEINLKELKNKSRCVVTVNMLYDFLVALGLRTGDYFLMESLNESVNVQPTVTYTLEDIEELAQEGNTSTFIDVPTTGFKISPVQKYNETRYYITWYDKDENDWHSIRGYIPMSAVIDELNSYLDKNNIPEEPEFYICQ